MARNFPTWETTRWDYEKGNLNDETKRYAVEAARRVKAHGGVIHFFKKPSLASTASGKVLSIHRSSLKCGL